MKIIDWKLQLGSVDIEFNSYPTRLKDKHKFHCKNCDSTWWKRLDLQLKVRQCPFCRIIVTYLIYFPTLDLYKIGYSSSFFTRKNSFGHTAETVLLIEHETIEQAKALETKWLANVDTYNTGLLTSGNTETFKI